MRMRRRRRLTLLFLIAAAAVVLFLVVFLIKDSRNTYQERGDYRLRYQYDNIVERDGVRYRERKNVTSILLMGVDRTLDSDNPTGSVLMGGQADFLRLLVIDAGRKMVSQVQIDRDTMTPITVLGPLGDKLGYADYQICLAHSFGDGLEQSCGFEVEAVSTLLNGARIDYYMALNMDGISVLNDELGGVTVTMEEDFSHRDPAMAKGVTLTLMGEQAEIYVRGRMDIGDGTNEARMRRQQQYIGQITSKLNQRINDDKNFVGTIYDALSEYLTTDISRGLLINEAWNARRYYRPEILEIPGAHTIGKRGYVEFHADETAIRDMMLELFYEPLK